MKFIPFSVFALTICVGTIQCFDQLDIHTTGRIINDESLNFRTQHNDLAAANKNHEVFDLHTGAALVGQVKRILNTLGISGRLPTHSEMRRTFESIVRHNYDEFDSCGFAKGSAAYKKCNLDALTKGGHHLLENAEKLADNEDLKKFQHETVLLVLGENYALTGSGEFKITKGDKFKVFPAEIEPILELVLRITEAAGVDGDVKTVDIQKLANAAVEFYRIPSAAIPDEDVFQPLKDEFAA